MKDLDDFSVLLGCGIMAFIVTILLLALFIGFNTVVIYVCWNLVCDVFALTYWISWVQALVIGVVGSLVVGFFK